MIDFEKAFFPKAEDKYKQKELLNKLIEERISHYTNQGFSKQEAEERIDKEEKEFMERGYYS